MKINTLGPDQYIDGREYGYDKTVKIHKTANLVGDIDIGPNTRIDGNVTITGRVIMGENCHIAVGACLYGSGMSILIGNNCGISAGVKMFSGTDDPDSGCLSLHAESTLKRAGIVGPITLGDYVIIGANSVVMPHSLLATKTVIGSLSFVRGYFATGIYAGAPARLLRARPPLEYGLV